jgi:alanine racemase
VSDEPRAVIEVDLDAIRANIARLSEIAGGTPLLVVVKADGYGHGMLQVARTARAAGVPWLGVATLDEAAALRADGDMGRLLAWLAVPGEDYRPAIEADVDVSVSTAQALAEVEGAAREVGAAARVHLKVDTGLNRGGCAMADWPDLVAEARAAEKRGHIGIAGVWSHYACADTPDHPANDEQDAAFAWALETAASAGLRPEVRHLSASAAVISRPGARYDLVRVGLAVYGLSPIPDRYPAKDLGLTQAMTVSARLALVKGVDTGASVSYGHTWTAQQPTWLGLVPVGYAEGIPRAASSVAEVSVRGRRRPIAGRVCMDQFLVDLGDEDVSAGDEIVLVGPDGPTAQDWADACGTISYEIVTRIGGRFARRYTGTGVEEAAR